MYARIQSILQQFGSQPPQVALVLGSGLNFFADERIEVYDSIDYDQIPGMAPSTVMGHRGRMVFGVCARVPLVCMQGRLHYYEGYSMRQVTEPIRILKSMGITTLILTNAAGGIHSSFEPGTLMLIRDHINFMGTNPLIGAQKAQDGARFPDMTEAYDSSLRKRAKQVARELEIELAEGIYLACSGPSFETPAEIRAFAAWGADAVGMSTVPECIVARQCGMRVCGISCITNAAAGLGNAPLSHEEVAATADKVKYKFARLLEGILSGLREHDHLV